MNGWSQTSDNGKIGGIEAFWRWIQQSVCILHESLPPPINGLQDTRDRLCALPDDIGAAQAGKEYLANARLYNSIQ